MNNYKSAVAQNVAHTQFGKQILTSHILLTEHFLNQAHSYTTETMMLEVKKAIQCRKL